MHLPLEPLQPEACCFVVVIGSVSPIVFLTVLGTPALVRENCRWVLEGRAVLSIESVCQRRGISSSRAAACKVSDRERGSRAPAPVPTLKQVLITKRSAAWARATELP